LENLENIFELNAKLVSKLLLTFVYVGYRVVPQQPLAGASDSEPVLVKKAPDLTNQDNILPLVISAISAPFERL